MPAQRERTYRASPYVELAREGRIITGICSVLGNRDEYGTRIMPGAFLKTIRENASNIQYLWQHDSWSPPVAVIRSLREVGREELPQSIQEKYPEALGGLEVVREYADTPRGNELLKLIELGAIKKMSIGFEVIQADTQDRSTFREVKLWDASDVNWAGNQATVASLSFEFVGVMLRNLIDHVAAETRAGARHSADDTKSINELHRLIVELGATTCAGIIDPDAAPDAANDTPTDAGSRAADALTLERLMQRARAADNALAAQGRAAYQGVYGNV